MTDQLITDRTGTRVAALDKLSLLDSESEQAFDDIVYIAAQTCGAPIALVSLLNADRQWFKAKVGLDVCETPIDQSVCQLDIDRPTLLEIRNLSLDPRTADNPLVTGPRAFRFYAGAPLILKNGIVVGRLCVIDIVPRPTGLTEAQRTLLGALARQVSDQIELRRVAQKSQSLAALQSALIDVSDVVRHSRTIEAMTVAAAEVVGRALSVDRAGFGTVDEGTETVDIEPDWTAPGVASIAGHHRFEDFGRIRDELVEGHPLVIEDIETDPRTAPDPAPMRNVGIGALVNMPIRNHGNTVAVFIVHAAGARRWTEEELAFLRSVADRLEAGVARLRLEQQQEAINGEISHRMKNMLMMVQAIASQTLRGVADRQPIETFEQRLVALSTAHDLLMTKAWIEADLRMVIDAALAPFSLDNRVAVFGPPVPLGSRAALSAALLIHELTTNAIKYGALSTPEGRIDIAWDVAKAGGGSELTLRWRESGGPPAAVPSRKGFGSRLIRMGLVGTGGVDLRYEATGFEADMRASTIHLMRA